MLSFSNHRANLHICKPLPQMPAYEYDTVSPESSVALCAGVTLTLEAVLCKLSGWER